MTERRTVREVLVEQLVKHGSVGTAEQAQALIENMLFQEAPATMGARGYACPCCGKMLSICGKHGPYRRSDENQCPACRRGE